MQTNKHDRSIANPAGGAPLPPVSTPTLAGDIANVADRIVDVDVDRLDDDAVRALLTATERTARKLDAARARFLHTLTSRAAERARAQQPGQRQAPERASREVRRQVARDLRLSPSQAKQADDTGRQLARRPRMAAAAGRGELPDHHLRQLTRTLQQLATIDAEARDAVEEELIDAAADLDAVAFGRLCRRKVIELDMAAAQRDLDRRHTQRSGRLAERPDGMVHLGVDVTGVDAEWLTTAVHAFRRPDIAGQHRRPEQRTADAVVEMARAALSTLDDPDARAARPVFHIMINEVNDGDLDRWHVGQPLHTGPLPHSELTRLLGDSHVSAILGEACRLPVAVTEQVRTVPAGLWRLLVARDGGCIWDGCDAPAAWCDVMHLDVDYADGGRLTPDTAGLGCRHHHRRIDRGTAHITWLEGRPVAAPPATPSHPPPASLRGPARGPAPGPPPDTPKADGPVPDRGPADEIPRWPDSVDPSRHAQLVLADRLS